MQWKIIDITETSKYLKVDRGFLQVFKEKKLLGQIALDEILGVVVSGYGHILSTSCINRLTENNISLIFCSNNQQPSSYCFPVQVINEQSKRMIAQAYAKIPLKKQLWKKIIERKIKNQSYVADILGLGCKEHLLTLSACVKSGDSTNRESVAAKIYWKHLLGKNFRRNRKEKGINSVLNYGYIILRACVARAVTGAGLHPTLGLHHKGPNNSMCLVDDLMEPFRPIIDYIVWHICEENGVELSKQSKAKLSSFAIINIDIDQGITPFSNALFRMTGSLVKIFLGEINDFFIPNMPKHETLQEFLS